ncbi:MAG: transcriptional repressor LexA [Deltaproteobacteria bacterium]|nr:transcriptional repressor LexA [Deltaproteobacteria bacterium]
MANANIPQLTDRQKAVLTFIESEILQHGYPPTIREIGKQLGIRSTNGVNDHLKALEKKGYVRREGQKSRTLRVLISSRGRGPEPEVVSLDTLDPAFAGNETFNRDAYPSNSASNSNNVIAFPGFNDDLIDVPLLGRVAAGAPILAEENAEDTVRVSSFFLGGERQQKVFALTVVGESMIDDGIFDGDFLFVRKQAVARPGEIVVAMIEGEATVKRYFPEGDRIRLQPANASMEPIFVNKKDFRQTDILGVVVGVYRKMHALQ